MEQEMAAESKIKRTGGKKSDDVIGKFDQDFETRLGKVLKGGIGYQGLDESKLFELFEKLSPSQIDSELRNLVVFDEIEVERREGEATTRKNINLRLLVNFLKFIKIKLGSKLDYELSNSYLSIFLNIHEDYILKDQLLKKESVSRSGQVDEDGEEIGDHDVSPETARLEEELKETLSEILDVLDLECDNLSFKFDQSLSVVGWLKHSVV